VDTLRCLPSEDFSISLLIEQYLWERLLTWPIGSYRYSNLNSSALRVLRQSNVRRHRPKILTFLNNTASSRPEGCLPTLVAHRRIRTALDHKVAFPVALADLVPSQVGLALACLLALMESLLRVGFLQVPKALINHQVPSGLQCPVDRLVDRLASKITASNIRASTNLRRDQRAPPQAGHR